MTNDTLYLRSLVNSISNTDTMIYYDELPSEAEIVALREQIQDSPGGWYGKDPEHGYAEYYFIQGVKCDFGHTRIRLLGKRAYGCPGQSRHPPLYGHELIEQWKTRARAYPDALVRCGSCELWPPDEMLCSGIMRKSSLCKKTSWGFCSA